MLKGTSTKQKARLTISESKEFVEMRGLTSTAGMFVDVYPCSAIYAGKILKGAKPSGLPVQQPINFQFFIR
jgi:hypothetical protein